MLRRTYDEQSCSIARALEVAGERWSLLILRDVVILGHHRFDEFLESLEITRGVLSARLRYLVEEGVLERRRYQVRPDRFEYHPTVKGLELWPVLGHLMFWGDRHYPEEHGPPRLVRHAGCGGSPDASIACDRCGQQLGPSDVDVLIGPGFVDRRRASTT